MFKCNVCSYETDRKYNLQHHNNRKNKCKPLIDDPIQQKNGFDNTSKQKRDLDNKCTKCNKCFNLKQVLTRHFKNCSGLNPLECQICFKIFKTSIAKCQHNRKVKCERPIDVPETLQEGYDRQKMELKRMAEENDGLKIQMAEGLGFRKSGQPNEEIWNLKATQSDKEYIQHKEEDNAALKIEAYKIKIELENKKWRNTIEALKQNNETKETYELNPNRKPKLKRGYVNQVTRNKVAASQKWCCRMCTEILPGVFHIDHTRPLKYGGKDILENVTALCIQCHAEKTQNDSNIWDNIANEEIVNI